MLSTLTRCFPYWNQLSSGRPSHQNAAKETAWLDGVRGLAAFLVVMNHYNLEWLSVTADAPFGSVMAEDYFNPDGVWHYQKGDRLLDIWRLPILRMFVSSGNAQVAVFFVLSGFVLSWSPLAALRAGRMAKLAQSLGSSIIRRWIRLYLPCFILSYIYFLLKIVVEYQGVTWIFKELWQFIMVMESWSDPFKTLHVSQLYANNPYNYVMWTIPFEFGGSIFIYTLLLAVGRIQDYKRRTVVLASVSLYAFLHAYWCQWLFGTGTILADYVRQCGGFEQLSRHSSRLASRLWFVVLILGLLLMGSKAKDDRFVYPGYERVQTIVWPSGYKKLPGKQWLGVGAILFITSCCHLNAARKFFELGPLQYLGRISFMLYLDHMLINTVVALPLRRLLYNTLCAKVESEIFNSDIYVSNTITNLAIYCILWVVSVPIAMSTAHFLEGWVDRPSTLVGRVIDEKLIYTPKDMVQHQDNEEAVLVSDSNGLLENARNDEFQMSLGDSREQRLS